MTLSAGYPRRAVRDPPNGRFVPAILALLILPLLIIIASFASLGLLANLGNLSPLPSPTQSISLHSINASLPNQFLAPPPPPPNINPEVLPGISLADVLVGLAVLFVVYKVVRILRKRLRKLTFTHVDTHTEEKRKEVAAILDATASELISGPGYREIVLRCYKLISGVLERESTIDGKALTAREFRKSVSERLKFDSPYLSEMTDLFELARYSNSEIVQEQALEASRCLSNLSAALKFTTASSPKTPERLQETVN